MNVILSEQKHLFIGNDCLLSFGIWVRNADPHLIYDVESHKRVNPTKSIYIGDHVWIGQSAMILKGRKVAKNVRAIIIPATQDIYLKAIENGLVKIFIEAGCVVSTPTCGPCLGGYMGILAAGERAVATTNRNFVGRMGDVTSEVYLASPAVAAASAILGKIADPLEL